MKKPIFIVFFPNIKFYSGGTSWPMRKLRKVDSNGNQLSIEEWCVLMHQQNAEAEKAIPLTVWDHIRVCYCITYFVFQNLNLYLLQHVCIVLESSSAFREDKSFNLESIGTMLVCH
jgi:hypothetical protein